MVWTKVHTDSPLSPLIFRPFININDTWKVRDFLLGNPILGTPRIRSDTSSRDDCTVTGTGHRLTSWSLSHVHQKVSRSKWVSSLVRRNMYRYVANKDWSHHLFHDKTFYQLKEQPVETENLSRRKYKQSYMKDFTGRYQHQERTPLSKTDNG